MGDLGSALFGTFLGLVSAFITSLVIPWVQKRQEKKEVRRTVHERYAQPLAADAVNLLWRLDEILFRKRAQYLDSDAPPTPFNRYKLISTCYRIAVVLGWIRAIRLEQSYLFYGDQDSVDDLRAAVVALESALADKPHVELHVLAGLAALWNLPLPADQECVARMAAEAAAETQNLLAAYRLARDEDVVRLGEAEKRDVARHMAGRITAALKLPPVDPALLAETADRAADLIGLRQAWVYRDWQQAIGTLMIVRVDGAVRRFDVLDYGAFEAMVGDAQAAGRPWIDRLREVIIDIDPREPHTGDFRVAQLRALARALAALVCAIERLDLERKILDPKACALARRFLVEIPPPSGSD